MIPAQSTMTQVNELPGDDEIEFGIGDPRWTMRNAADMYSNRELAVVREYSTNAFDANKERALLEDTDVLPIEVSLPTITNPEFSVRDFGYGMDRETLTKVYTQFGISTKRTSNDYNGMLGYGSKSAVAYSTQFTITSVSNGRKVVAVVNRRPDWSIGMKIVIDAPSDEASGTTIRVPVHNPQEFSHKAHDFYKFWRTGTVLIDGKPHVQFAGDTVVDGLYLSTNHNSYIVMGNVPYRIENPMPLFNNTGLKQFNFVIYTDTGNVEFVPNREALKYTELTKKTLYSLLDGFADVLKAEAMDEISKAGSHADAYNIWTKWDRLLTKAVLGELDYKGDKFVDEFMVQAYYYKYDTRGYNHNLNSYRVSSVSDTLFVTGMGPGDPSSSQKKKVNDYKNHKGIPLSRPVLFVRGDTIDSPWVDTNASNFISWEDLKAATPKPVRTGGTGGRTKQTKGTFDGYTSNGKVWEITIPTDHAKVFKVSALEARRGTSPSGVIDVLPASLRDVTVIIVPANRQAKFLRDYPEVKEFYPWAKSHIIMDGSTLLSDKAKKYIDMGYHQRTRLQRFDANLIDDVELKFDIEVAKGGSLSQGELAEYNRNLALASRFSMQYTEKVEYTSYDYQGLLEDRYPLIDAYDVQRHREDTYLYMNAKYQQIVSARKDEDE